MEEIRYAAIWRNDNCIVLGKSHSECIRKSPKGTCKGKGATQGFWTNNARFVDRKEAFIIALKSNQICEEVSTPIVLYSEDIETENYMYVPNKGYIKKY